MNLAGVVRSLSLSQPSRRRAARGFTLIEIIVVVAIIALLAAVIIPVVAGQISKAKITSQTADLQEISNAFTRFYVDTQMWPPAALGAAAWDPNNNAPGAPSNVVLGTNALWAAPAVPVSMATSWKGPYLNTSSKTFGTVANGTGVLDRWSQPYQTSFFPAPPAAGSVATSPGGSIVIWSIGPNGVNDASAFIGLNAACPTDPTVLKDDVCVTVTQKVK